MFSYKSKGAIFPNWREKRRYFSKFLCQSRAVTLLQICKKTKIYNTNVDLVSDNVYTKFGINLFIRSQDIEQKQNSDINQRSNSLANLRKTMIYFIIYLL